MNGAVSKVDKKFISHLTRAKRTPLAAAAVPVSYVLITVLQCVHPGSHDTHPHGNQIHPRLGVACLLRRHLGNWPRRSRSKHEKLTASSVCETWTVAAADGVGFARVRWEINLLLTFETAPFFCKCTAYLYKPQPTILSSSLSPPWFLLVLIQLLYL